MRKKDCLLVCCCFSGTAMQSMIPAMVILQTVYLDSRKALLMVNIRMEVLKIHVTAVTIPLASLNGAWTVQPEHLVVYSFTL